MQEIFQLIEKTYGLAGLILALPIFVSWILWKNNQDLLKKSDTDNKDFHSKLVAANERVVEAQKQRVEDAQKISAKLLEVVAEQSSLNKETNLLLAQLEDSVSKLSVGKGRS